MTNANGQSTAGIQGASKTWSEPTLEKIEINETAVGVVPNGSLEGQFPQFPAS
ncbi:MAG: hypothetical protein AAGH68_06455 [Pseudomonadota bacterium]